ncbi:TSUP family transporter [Teredinibacter turnerae]|uniref:TSUP family transporter n=1 Tax=Teredinibacter turnerae TaxID=2426 RepID=UPI000425EA56|nr:TSUP family transporter [Teredinibacter turnerae]
MDIVDSAHLLLISLFLTAIIAGFLDTLAGGGGLLTVPALVLSGVSPLLALGTNKLQGCTGTAVATYMMFKNQRVQWRLIRWQMLLAFAGAAAGSIAIQFVNTDALEIVIPIVLFGIGLYFLLGPRISNIRPYPIMSDTKYERAIVPSIGFYDGMFGPGTGSFYALAGTALKGYELVQATATAKPLNFSTNIASLMIFVSAGNVAWKIGACMMAGQALGSWIGARTLLRIDPRWLRFFIVTMCFGMLAKYLLSISPRW